MLIASLFVMHTINIQTCFDYNVYLYGYINNINTYYKLRSFKCACFHHVNDIIKKKKKMENIYSPVAMAR